MVSYVDCQDSSVGIPPPLLGQSSDIMMTSGNRKCSALTGSARKIKDNAADWHNLMIRWEKLNEEGFILAGNIVELRMTR